MKKLLSLLLIVALMISCVACGNKAGGNTNAEIADANEILTKAWEDYLANASEDMKFPLGGGNGGMNMDAPAKFDFAAEGAEDELVYNYCATAETIAMMDDAATAANMMMLNNFAVVSCHVADAANTQTVVDSFKNTVANFQWMCGMPDEYAVVTVGDDYVVFMYGNAQVIPAFKTSLSNVYGDAAVVVDEGAIAQ